MVVKGKKHGNGEIGLKKSERKSEEHGNKRGQETE